ncbi:hypothetical protein SPRG_18897 [Saprolegnia parasitica CBS 223.65]|uniref:Uncharacterized protein n=1 Tax=Saprolegnia parasitica (strain CBS 223.65) TaxID=695850 RepID=A0A067D2P6_SAPPC|nr:hypothetical protein SPRG_18897 [Saprolegnia parasitica CBS 223.65]KDO35755.1 hypothetical protein SPRG_18897 [Saprolegnia parasitica CBS 223.65]|eukprot:XP_012194111.1 hypothetical protein SPRG_18897 [Saprolegnia parasitica CBS 223.65]
MPPATSSAMEAPVVPTELAAVEPAVVNEHAVASSSSDDLECKPDPLPLRPRPQRSLQTRTVVRSVTTRVKEERASSPRRLRPRWLANRHGR